MGFGVWFWGVMVGQIEFAGWWVGFLGQVCCVGAWGVVFGGWRVVLGGFGLARGGFGTVWDGFGGMVLGVCGWDRAGQNGFVGCCVGVLGLVGGVGVWGARFGGWADVLGLGGLVLGLRGGDVGRGRDGFGDVVVGFGVGQFGFTGWWGVFWGSVGCVGAWGIGIWDWRGGYWFG